MCEQLEEDQYREIYIGGESEIVEKKSRFISTTAKIGSEDEAIAFVEKVRKKYWDARHHCYAFTIGRNYEICRCSDDGEPSGTAGKPIMDILIREELHNSIILVTRYFGGTLLGTGGLIRAYMRAAKEGIANSHLIDKTLCQSIKIVTDYQSVGKIQYIASLADAPIIDSKYTEKVVLELLPRAKTTKQLCQKVIEATGGRAQIDIGELYYAAIIDNEVVRF